MTGVVASGLWRRPSCNGPARSGARRLGRRKRNIIRLLISSEGDGNGALADGPLNVLGPLEEGGRAKSELDVGRLGRGFMVGQIYMLGRSEATRDGGLKQGCL